jgi:DNA-binding NarL/FixJ family response regulator
VADDEGRGGGYSGGAAVQMPGCAQVDRGGGAVGRDGETGHLEPDRAAGVLDGERAVDHPAGLVRPDVVGLERDDWIPAGVQEPPTAQILVPPGMAGVDARGVEFGADAHRAAAGIDAAYQLLNLQAVDAEISQIAQLAESTRLPLARWHLLRQQASRAALAGQLEIARARSQEAGLLAHMLQDPSGAGLSYSFAVWLAVLRGDPTEIPADFFDVVAAAPPIPVVRSGLAMGLFTSGRTDEAQAVYETLRQLPADADRDVRNFGAFTQMLELIIAFRDTATARACYDLLAPHAAEAGVAGTGLVVLYGSLDWPLGRLAGLLGRTEEALEHFTRAAAVNTRLGARPLVVLTRLDWAAALTGRAAGRDLAQARGLARQAAAEAVRLDMPGPADRAESLARELEQAMATANPLTRREREIAGLVSDGLTNRAIAGRLVLSERTVEGHVRSTLAKLQLTNRTELAAWALRDNGS